MKKTRPRPSDLEDLGRRSNPAEGRGVWALFKRWLGAPVDGASLAAFRIALGLVMCLEAYSLGQPNVAAISSGLTPLQTYYSGAEIKFHFPYACFGWLPVLSPSGMNLLAVLQAVAGITVAIGFCYRAAIVTLFLAWGYFFAIESTRSYWQSHYYLELLVLFLMLWMPAAQRYSVDAWRRRGPPGSIPFWPIALLRGQLVVAYFFAGVAKLNSDWLINAVPVRWFLREPGVTEPFKPFLTPAMLNAFKAFLQSSEVAFFFCYVGVAFDLLVGGLFLIRRTRVFAMVLMNELPSEEM